MTASPILSQQAAPAAPAAPAVPSRSELAEQIRKTTQDALEGARAGTEAANRSARTVHIVSDGHTVDIAPVAPVLSPGQIYAWPDGGPAGGMPGQVADVAYAFFAMIAVIAVGWPIARAFGRRIERRGELAPALAPAVADQLHRIEQAVEAMSIEVERISESQRFVAKLQQGATAERV